MRSVLSIVAATILLAGGTAGAQAPTAGSPFAVAITAPAAIEEYPAIEKTLTVTVSNTGHAPVHDLLLYMTMADVTRNLVVDLLDFSATRVYAIDTIEPMKSINLEIPLKLAFTGDFYLYMTAISKETGMTAFSKTIPVKILGTTSPSKDLVIIVSAAVPGLLLALLLGLVAVRSNRAKAN